MRVEDADRPSPADTSSCLLVLFFPFLSGHGQEVVYTDHQEVIPIGACQVSQDVNLCMRLTAGSLSSENTKIHPSIPLTQKDLARVYEFDESNVDQRSFEKDDYFFRYEPRLAGQST